MLESLTLDEMLSVIRGAGFAAQKENDDTIGIRIEGHTFYILLDQLYVKARDKTRFEVMKFYVAYGNRRWSPSKVNEWNDDHRFTKVTSDSQGIRMEFDVVFVHTSEQYIETCVKLYIALFADFRKALA